MHASVSVLVPASPTIAMATAPHTTGPSSSPAALPPSSTAPFPAPRTPGHSPPSSANRRLVRPLLLQRNRTTSHLANASTGSAGARTPHASPQLMTASARYPPSHEAPQTSDLRSTNSADSSDDSSNNNSNNDSVGREYRETAHALSHPTDPNSGAASRSTLETGEETADEAVKSSAPAVPTVLCSPIRPTSASHNGARRLAPPLSGSSAGAPPAPVKHLSTFGPVPSTTATSGAAAHADDNFGVSSYLSSAPSDIPASWKLSANGFSGGGRAVHGDSGNTLENGEASLIGPLLSSPATAGPELQRATLSLRSRQLVPPLTLRESLSPHTLGDDVFSTPSIGSFSRPHISNPSVASSTSRWRVGGAVPVPLLSGASSVASGPPTPLASSRSSRRPSFLRSAVPPSSARGVTPIAMSVAGETNWSTAKDGGSPSLPPRQPNETGMPHAVNGRLLGGNHSLHSTGSAGRAHRPELSARRTTFERAGSNASLSSASHATPHRGAVAREEDSDGAATFFNDSGIGTLPPAHRVMTSAATTPSISGAPRPVSPPLSKEMRSFVLHQYRALQHEVLLALPTPPHAKASEAEASAQTDIHAPDFVHTKKCTCPRHSKAVKRAELREREEARLRALQQQHHDMAIIRNGGREEVGRNMKSSVLLAGSLSKWRARAKSTLPEQTSDHLEASMNVLMSATANRVTTPALFGTSGGDADRLNEFRGSTVSQDASRDTTSTSATTGAAATLYGREAEHQEAPSQIAETEAWCTSKSFMAAAPSASVVGSAWQQQRQNTRTVNKNGMKGEAIVVAVMPDSDDEESDSSREQSVRRSGGGGFNRTRSSAERRVSTSTISGRRAPSPTGTATRSLVADTMRIQEPGDSSDDDSETCFSFKRLRHPRLHSIHTSNDTLSLSTSQPLEPRKFSSTQIPARSPDVTPSNGGQSAIATPVAARNAMEEDASGSGDSDDRNDGEGEDVCCFCCPCKRPENFFALCRTNSHSASSSAWREDLEEPAPCAKEGVAQGVRTAAALAEAAAATVAPMKNALSPEKEKQQPVKTESAVLLEDLEGDDDEPPLLSMQSFRRANIQRVR